MLGSGFAAALPHVMSIITLQAILENIPLVLNGRGWYSTAKEYFIFHI